MRGGKNVSSSGSNKPSVSLLLALLLTAAILASSYSASAQPASSFGSGSPGLPANTPVSFTIFFPPGGAGPLNDTPLSGESYYNAGKAVSSGPSVFSSSRADFSSVLSYLETQGFTPEYVSSGKYALTMQGTAVQVGRTFGVSFVTRQVGTESYYFPSGTPRLPQELNGLQVTGFTNYTSFAPQYVILGRLNQTGLYSSNLPRSVSFQPGLFFSATYYTPNVFQRAYNETPLLDKGVMGQGQTIAIIDAYGDPTVYQDVQNFDSFFSLPPLQLKIIPIGPYQPDQGIGTGWDVETALDVQAAHMMAPYAKIDLIVINGNDTANGFFDAIDMVVSQHLANVTSMSWGQPENLFGASGFYAAGVENYPFADYYFSLGASEGISFFAASGDDGAYGGTPTVEGGVSFPASSPYVTAVGGTTLYAVTSSGSIYAAGSNVSYAGESAWSISPQYPGSTVSSGGGYSTLFSAPWYQQQVTGSGQRAVPDVSADANPYTGAVIYFEGQKIAIGGTSLASPMVAGMTALLDQYTVKRLGPLNPYLYAAYSSPSRSSAFHQIPFGSDGYYSSGTGYNLVTGLGSLNLGGFADYVKGTGSNLSVQVTTSAVNSPSYPQYSYGSPFNITAAVALPDGATATSGNFAASIFSEHGFLASVPLSLHGNVWVGTYTPVASEPPDVWEVVVSGSSGGYTGTGSASIDVGLSVNIVSPIPYPIGPPIEPGSPFLIQTQVISSDGSPITNGSFTATFYYLGKSPEFQVPLLSAGQGLFTGVGNLGSSYPQGVYTMVVNGTSGGQSGSAYTYEYFGEAVIGGTIFTPVDEAVPTASPGQQITMLAETMTASGLGIFDSNITAYFYSSSGAQVGEATLRPAPNTVQFGTLNLFGFQQANYTIPANFTSGFYTVKFVSSYGSGTSEQHGFYTTGIYISSSSLSVDVSNPGATLEGQNVQITASIRYSNGTAVKSGVFLATVSPVALDYASNVVGADTGSPMQYDEATGQWSTTYQLPSSQSSGFYEGVPLYSLAGPWNIIVAGESGDAIANQPVYSYFTLLPFTQIGTSTITPSNAASVSMATYSGGTLTINGLGGTGISIEGLNVSISSGHYESLTLLNCTATISGTYLSSLDVVNSKVTLIGDTIGDSLVGVHAQNSSLLVQDTVFRNLTFAFDPVFSQIRTSLISTLGVGNLSSVPTPKVTLVSPSVVYSNVRSVEVSINGSFVTVQSTLLNGVQVIPNVTAVHSGVIVNVPFDSSFSPDGLYTVTITFSNGLAYSSSLTFLNQYHFIQSQFMTQVVSAVAVLIGALAIVLVILSRRRGTSLQEKQQHPGQPPAEPSPTPAPAQPPQT